MYNRSNSSPTIANCTFSNNSAIGGGGNVQLQFQPHHHRLHLLKQCRNRLWRRNV